MNVFHNNKKYAIYSYATEDEFEQEIVGLSKSFFGEKTIYIDAKRKIESKTLGGTIPDGFFFDFSDSTDPQFFLVEVELASHSFFSHIFPQITKFFAFFKNHKQQKTLVEKLFTLINEDNEIKNEFKKLTGTSEIYKYLTDLIDNSQNILLVIDGEKKELPEILDTYTDTWGKMVKVLVIKKFIDAQNVIYAMEPEYEALDYIRVDEVTETTPEISENYHLDDVTDNIKQIYEKIKAVIKSIDVNLILNPQKYYISIKSTKNIAYIQIRKKKIKLLVMLPEEEIRRVVAHHNVSALSDSVQGFYNSACAAIEITNTDYFDEIKSVISAAYEITRKC
ncbi:MAG: DUF5655 domain-containing protein [Gammaproteobacteria bacterium]|nr:DUF5655 domain-containing protein [Gammaproteobacteria bacterium]MDH5653839.1 DUF5655 domain-containing protein [Gammaproteobacteria bacterium]